MLGKVKALMTDLVLFCCAAGELGERVTLGWECYCSKAVPDLRAIFHPSAAFRTATHFFVAA